MTASTCAKFMWCEYDHFDPANAEFPNVHERHVTLTVGDSAQEFMLEIDDKGRPRLEAVLDVGEVWLEPDESTNTLRNLSDLYRRAADIYDAFVRDVTPTLRRDHNVTRELAEVEN
ncbi:hypothetical protein [Microbacterium sp. A1-JK]|uniref:hypothetical protein n=1 Tax=Microbacterium sp. A1-JK TaxID=3177516 RepID=UPI00388A4FCE